MEPGIKARAVLYLQQTQDTAERWAVKYHVEGSGYPQYKYFDNEDDAEMFYLQHRTLGQ